MLLVKPDVSLAPTSVPRAEWGVGLTMGADVTTLTLIGELDLQVLAALRSLLDLATSTNPDRLVVDLGGVPFFDVGTATEFARARDRAVAYGGTFELQSVSLFARHLLELMGLDDIVAPLSGSAGAADPNGEFARHADELIERWASVCHHHLATPASVVIDEGSTIAEAVAHELDRLIARGAPANLRWPPHAGHPTHANAPPADRLLLLRRAAQSWARQTASPELLADRGEHFAELVDEAVLDVVTRALGQDALVDALTGLLNRRAADRDLEQAFARARRSGRPLTVMMLDVNDLKGTNDRLGHAAGDESLRELADQVTAVLRTGDDLYRVGGDEFMVLLPDLLAEDAATVIERARVGSSSTFAWGSATLSPDAHAAVDLRHSADNHLLMAKTEYTSEQPDLPSDGSARSSGVIGPHDLTTLEQSQLVDRLRAAGSDRLAVEMAKGIVAGHLDIPVGEALTLLRAHAEAHDLTLDAVAAGIVARTIDISALPRDRARLRAEPLVRSDEP